MTGRGGFSRRSVSPSETHRREIPLVVLHQSAWSITYGRERLAELHGMLEELMASLGPREVRV